MKDFYETKRLIVGNLCIIIPSNDMDDGIIGPLYIQTKERFIFEKVTTNSKLPFSSTCHKKEKVNFYNNIFFRGEKLLIYDSVLEEKIFVRNFEQTYITNTENIDKYLSSNEKVSQKISLGMLVNIYYKLNNIN